MNTMSVEFSDRHQVITNCLKSLSRVYLNTEYNRILGKSDLSLSLVIRIYLRNMIRKACPTYL